MRILFPNQRPSDLHRGHPREGRSANHTDPENPGSSRLAWIRATRTSPPGVARHQEGRRGAARVACITPGMVHLFRARDPTRFLANRKNSCRGRWRIPVDRVEAVTKRDETNQAAVTRGLLPCCPHKNSSIIWLIGSSGLTHFAGQVGTGAARHDGCGPPRHYACGRLMPTIRHCRWTASCLSPRRNCRTPSEIPGPSWLSRKRRIATACRCDGSSCFSGTSSPARSVSRKAGWMIRFSALRRFSGIAACLPWDATSPPTERGATTSRSALLAPPPSSTKPARYIARRAALSSGWSSTRPGRLRPRRTWTSCRVRTRSRS